MEPRPTIALILRACIYAAFQYTAYKAFGMPALIAAWAAIVIVTWIGVKTTVAKISQTVFQTAIFVVIIGVIHMNSLTP